VDEQNTNAFPDDLTGLSADDLTAAEERARAEYAEITSDGLDSLTDEQVGRMEQIADFLDSVSAEGTRREAEVADRAARAEAAATRIAPPTAEDGDGEDDGEEETPEEPEAPAEEPAAPESAPEAVEVTTEAPVAVAASASRPPVSTVRSMRQPANPTPAPEAPVNQFMSITASADIRDGAYSVQQGADLKDLSGAAPAFIGRLKGFPTTRGGGYDRKPVAQMRRDFTADRDGLYDSNEDFGSDTFRVLREASRESRLSGGSLVAAGGWCAPSENLYGMCADETLDGILDLPTIGVTRGGINYTPGPDFQDIYTDAGFVQTEAEAIAGTEKNCTEVDCPDFTEVRLDAVGICVKSPLLTRAAYPEVVTRFLEGTVIANQHKVNARIIAAMRTALGTALAPTLTGTPVVWSTLTAMEWVIEMQRQAYRLSEGETLEVIAPRWLRVALRADFANRNGIGVERVTNAIISDHFADRGASVQFVLGYLEVATPTTSVAFPASAEIMVYKAGTFVKGTHDVISLDAIYDAADLETNMFTAAFVEDGVLLAKMCHGGKRITLPVNVNGMLGAAQLDDNWGSAQAESAGA